MDGTLLVLTLISAVGCAVLAGVFFGFSVLVMPGLARTPAAHAVGVMQQINTAAIRPLFLATFLGTAAVSAVVTVWAIAAHPGNFGYLIAGGVLYLFGDLAVTIGYHAPRNDALARLDPVGSATPSVWNAYYVGWTRLNHVRAVAGLAASISFLLAAHH